MEMATRVAAFVGAEAESIAAIQFWADCARREHHGWKFNSYPELFSSLNRVQSAAGERDAIMVVRKARQARRLFLKDEHAYWPRLEARWLSPTQLYLAFSPSWYFISRIVYPGNVYLAVRVWIERSWRCEVSWSAMRVESGVFPDFDALNRHDGLHWHSDGERSVNFPPPLWPTVLMPYDAPSAAFPT
jgi:hypothetical protein